jgi:hypothetical protein
LAKVYRNRKFAVALSAGEANRTNKSKQKHFISCAIYKERRRRLGTLLT